MMYICHACFFSLHESESDDNPLTQHKRHQFLLPFVSPNLCACPAVSCISGSLQKVST